MESAMPKLYYSRPNSTVDGPTVPSQTTATTRVTYDVFSCDDMLNNHPSQNITYLGNKTTLWKSPIPR
jgi:hypothetical protein